VDSLIASPTLKLPSLSGERSENERTGEGIRRAKGAAKICGIGRKTIPKCQQEHEF